MNREDCTARKSRDLRETINLVRLGSGSVWAVWERPVGFLAVTLALSLAGCGVPWTERDSWWSLAVLAAFTVGIWLGMCLEYRGNWAYPVVTNKVGGRWSWTIREDASLRDIKDHLISVEVLKAKAEIRDGGGK